MSNPDRVLRTNDALADPALMGDIVGEVASGGTLAGLCRDRDLIYKLVNRWIADDDGRRQKYMESLDIRESHAKDEVIAELLGYIRADVTEAFDSTSKALKPLDQMPRDVRRLIAGIEVEELFEGRGESREHIGTLRKIKFWDKPRSVEILARHLKMLIERHEVTGKISLAELLADGAAAAQPKTV